MYKTSGKIAQWRRPRRFRLWGSGQGDDGVSPEPLPKHGRAVGVPTSSASSAPVFSLAGSTKYSSSRALSSRTASGTAARCAHQDMVSSSSTEPMASIPSILARTSPRSAIERLESEARSRDWSLPKHVYHEANRRDRRDRRASGVVGGVHDGAWSRSWAGCMTTLLTSLKVQFGGVIAT